VLPPTVSARLASSALVLACSVWQVLVAVAVAVARVAVTASGHVHSARYVTALSLAIMCLTVRGGLEMEPASLHMHVFRARHTILMFPQRVGE
jgi:hypothetical protein